MQQLPFPGLLPSHRSPDSTGQGRTNLCTSALTSVTTISSSSFNRRRCSPHPINAHLPAAGPASGLREPLRRVHQPRSFKRSSQSSLAAGPGGEQAGNPTGAGVTGCQGRLPAGDRWGTCCWRAQLRSETCDHRNLRLALAYAVPTLPKFDPELRGA